MPFFIRHSLALLCLLTASAAFAQTSPAVHDHTFSTMESGTFAITIPNDWQVIPMPKYSPRNLKLSSNEPRMTITIAISNSVEGTVENQKMLFKNLWTTLGKKIDKLEEFRNEQWQGWYFATVTAPDPADGSTHTIDGEMLSREFKVDFMVDQWNVEGKYFDIALKVLQSLKKLPK